MNRIELLKKMLPGLLPLIVFVIADEIWGTRIGLIVATAFGIVEFIFTYLKFKRIDKFILADTGLIIVMGTVSIILDKDIFFMLKPALIEAILCVIIGISAFSSKNIIMLMSQRYMKGMKINDHQQKKMMQSMKIMFFLLSLHTLLIVYSAYFIKSKEVWVFISGPLLYIIFGAFFIFELSKNKINIIRNSKAKWLPIVDKEGNVIGKSPRPECHNKTFILHPVVHLHVFNKNKELFLQKRPENKKVQPGKWDTAVGGHISFGEDLILSLERETEEEIGIKDFKPHLLKKYIWRSEIEEELVFMFITKYDGKINISEEELSDGRFWKMSEIKEQIGKGVFTPNFEQEFEILEKEIF